MADADAEQVTAGATEGSDNGAPAATENGVQEERTEQPGNKFQQAVAAWKTLNLSTLVSNLDVTAAEMVNQQKESLQQRRELAQKTKDFRKLDDSAKLADIKELLKAYQGYVDVLTNHNKTISSAFMQAYSPLSEAPDPYPLLEASIDALITADEVVPALESENERLNKQVSSLNAQVEDAEKQLDSERKRRQSFEHDQDDRIQDVEESWTAVLKEKEDNWAAKERSLEEKAENQDRLLRELKASYEVTQRLERSGEDNQVSSGSTATAAELEIVHSELDRTHTRLAEVEARNEQLRLELAQSAGHSKGAGKSTSIEDEPAFLRLRSENSSLLRRLDSARTDKDVERTKLDKKLRSVEREVAALKADRDTLQGKVSRWHDYEEVKRELDMLRAIEFAAVNDLGADDDDDNARSNGDIPKAKEESLEQLLVARNKKLSNELTDLRMSHQTLQQQLEQLQENMSIANMDLEKTRALNATLENDLQKTQQEAMNAFETMSVAGTWTSRVPKSTYGGRRGAGTSPTSSIIGGYDAHGGSGSPKVFDALRASEAVGAGAGILPMVTAQRDRFKKKIGELEQELQKQYQAVSSLRSEIASLQKDNLNLYEKTRYVSSYNRGPAASGAAYGANPNPSSIRVGGDAPGGLDRYRSAYEQNMSPFAAFRGRESARVMKRMSLPERVIFQITRMVLATRTSRNLFALYCAGLHILVLTMLYWMGSGDVKPVNTPKISSAAGPAAAAAANAAGSGEWQQEGFQ